jgi:hypothetical protein
LEEARYTGRCEKELRKQSSAIYIATSPFKNNQKMEIFSVLLASHAEEDKANYTNVEIEISNRGEL